MKTRTKWIIAVPGVVVIIPTGLYFLVNFYWWLFDGNIIDFNKMGMAVLAFACTAISMLLAAWISEDLL